MWNLNQRAAALLDAVERDADRLRIGSSWLDCGTAILDFGIDAPGGLEAGRRFAEVCMSGLGQVEVITSDPAFWSGPWVQVLTDHPVAACLASQYAGWELKAEGFFAMGSGPMRAVAATESIFEDLHLRETAGKVIGALECDRLPPAEICRTISEKCGISPDNITLLVAPVTSQAGTVQVVARSVETALHKMHELAFDVGRVESGWGVAPLPPVAAETVTGIGRTNDAVLYGSHVTLYLRGDDASLRDIGPRIPSAASHDFGRPFAQIFAEYDHDFYRIDPHLFSPAMVTLVNLDTGNSFRFGRCDAGLLTESFATSAAS